MKNHKTIRKEEEEVIANLSNKLIKKNDDDNDSGDYGDDVVKSFNQNSHYIIINDILKTKKSNIDKTLSIIQYFEIYYSSLKLRDQYSSEWEKMTNKFSLTSSSHKSKKNKTCSVLANLFCFIPCVCFKSSRFILQVVVSFIFLMCLILVLSLIKKIIFF